MTLNKEGFVCRVAYFFFEEAIPKRVNLCRLFWRFLFCFFFGIPMWYLYMGWLFLTGFFVGMRPPVFRGDDRNWLVPYKRWLRIGRLRVTPAGVILPVFFGWVAWILRDILNWKAILEGIGILIAIPLFLIAIVFIFALASRGVEEIMEKTREVRESEAVKLAKAFLKAKREKVCPYVEIVG